MKSIRILLADDHVVVRQGTRQLLEREQDFEIVGEAGDAGYLLKSVSGKEKIGTKVKVEFPM